MSNPSKPLLVALVGSRPLAGTPTCDEALDLNWKPTEVDPITLSKKLSDYERSRSEEDLARLPLLPGKELTLFEVHPLTASQYRYVVQAKTDSEAAHRAFLCACRRIVLPGGARELSTTIPSDSLCARIEWIDDVVFPTFGQDAIDEVGRIAIERAKAGPKAKLPFSLPLGLMLPR